MTNNNATSDDICSKACPMKSTLDAHTARTKPLKRASAPKAKTGCKTCKIRRKRCDEQWSPSCQNCIKAGWKCEGRSTTSVSVIDPACAALPVATFSISSYAIPFQLRGSTQNERRLFHYFCVQGSTAISGYIKSDFWKRIVLQASHVEPVIQKAVIAVSAAHLDHFSNRNNSDHAASSGHSLSDITIRHYVSAVRALRKHLASTEKPLSRKTVLICCIIFHAFESIRGDYEPALKHLDNGLNILRTYNDPHTALAEEDFDELAGILLRTDLMEAAGNATRVPVTLRPFAEYRPQASYTTTVEAQSAYSIITSNLFRLLSKNEQYNEVSVDQIPHEVIKQKQQIIDQMDDWYKSFSRHRVTCLDLNESSHTHEEIYQLRRGLIVVDILYHLTRMAIANCLPRQPSTFDGGQYFLETILQLISSMNAADAIHNGEYNLEGYTVISSSMIALWIIGMNTMDLSVLQRIITLVASTPPRHEGRMTSQNVLALLSEQMRRRQQGLDLIDLAPFGVPFYIRPATASYEKTKMEGHDEKLWIERTSMVNLR